METKIDIKQVLRVYFKIVERGQKVGDEHRLGDLYASSDLDGYNVVVRDDLVTAHIAFHSKCRVDYKKSIHLAQFISRLEALDKRKVVEEG